MKNCIVYISLIMLTGVGCSKEINAAPSIKVSNCSYDDEYFDYCEGKYLDFYKKILNEKNVNFNKKYILTPVGGNNNSYSGIVAINKETGSVDTMLFNYKKINGKELSFNTNSDVFCINGEVNSKSFGVTKNGKSCFKYNKIGFELLKEEINKFKITSLPYSSKDHDNCYMTSDKKSCSKVNLISSNSLSNTYNFIYPSYGDSVILPRTPDDKEIIISLSEDEGGPQIIISTIDKFKKLRQRKVYINKDVEIDKNYTLHYLNGKKEIREKL